MKDAMQYELCDQARRRRLRQCTDLRDPEDLRAELGACRLLAQEALEQGQIPLANAILVSVAKLSQAQVAAKRLRSEYLERATVTRLAMELVELLSRSVMGRFEGWESVLEQVADQVSAAVAAASNQPREDKHE